MSCIQRVDYDNNHYRIIIMLERNSDRRATAVDSSIIIRNGFWCFVSVYVFFGVSVGLPGSKREGNIEYFSEVKNPRGETKGHLFRDVTRTQAIVLRFSF